MNKIFKVVWSKAKQCYVVVSEVAKNHSGKKKIVVASVLAALAVGSEIAVVNVQATIIEGTVSGTNTYGVAIGNNSSATATATDAFAIGTGTVVSADSAAAVGRGASASGASSTAVGRGATAAGGNSVALGRSANTTDAATDAFAIGTSAVVSADSAAAVGRGASASGASSTAVGRGSSASAENSIALGRGATAAGAGSVALGWNTRVTADDVSAGSVQPYLLTASKDAVNDSANGVVAIGTQRNTADSGFTRRLTGVGGGVNDYDAVNLKQLRELEKHASTRFLAVEGLSNRTKANYADETWNIEKVTTTTTTDSSGTPTTTETRRPTPLLIKGNYDNEGAVGSNAVAIGPWANAMQDRSTAVGSHAIANGRQGIAVGQYAVGIGENSLSLGSYATVNGNNSISIGTDTYVGVATRTGSDKRIGTTGDDAEYSLAIGFSAKTLVKNAMTIGKGARTELEHSITLGEASVTKAEDGTATTAYLSGDAVNNSGNGVLSIGSIRNTADGRGVTRRIVGVAGGSNDFDAVNVKQLKALETATTNKLSTMESNEWLLQTKNASDANVTDVTAKTVTGETKKRVVLEASDNITLENSDGTVKIKANVGVKSITSGNTTALTVSTVDANGAVTITPNIATNLSASGDSGKLVTAGTVNTAIAGKVDTNTFNTALGAKLDKTAERHVKEGSYAVAADGTVTLTKVDGANTEKPLEAVKITGLATKASVDTLTTKVGIVEATANAAKAGLADKADKSTVTDLTTKVGTVEATANAAKAGLADKADKSTVTDLTTKVGTVEATANAAKAGLADKADKSTVTDLTTKVGTVEATANAAKAGLADKADKSAVTDLTTKVGTVEATANAAKTAAEAANTSLADKADKSTVEALTTEVGKKANASDVQILTTNKLDKTAERHVKQGTYTVAADGSVTLTKVDGEGTEKADEAVVINGLATKASVDNLTTEVGKKANQTAVDDLTTKVGTVETTANAAKAGLADKADKSTVTDLTTKVGTVEATANTAKAAAEAANTALADKADKATVEALTTEVGKKANATDVEALTTEVGKKANASDVEALTTEVGKKADAATVNAELAKKVNAADLQNLTSNKVDKTAERHVKQGTYTVAADGSVTLTKVDGEGTEKADEAVVINGFATKASVDNLITEVGKKANATDVEALTTEVDKKANAADVTAELAKKANADDVRAELAKKANADDITAELAKKANVDDITAELAKKSNAADVTAELAKKANATDVEALTTEVGKKANAADMTAELAKKINAADLQNLTSNKVDKTAERHVKQGTYTVSADGSVTLTKVDGEGTEKADEAVVINGFATKASVDNLTTEVGKKANQTAVDDLTTKVGTVETTANAAKAGLADKADKSTVTDLTTKVGTVEATANTAKAAAEAANTALADKADKATVEALTTEVGKKANATDVEALTTEVGKKANASDVEALTTEVGKKADAATVNAELAKKVNAADLQNLTSNKVDKTAERHVKQGTYTVAADGSVTLTKVDGEGTEKADEAVVINGFATKASVDNLITEVGKKANATDVEALTTEVDKKANAADVTAELAKKANADDVRAELAKKANVDDITAELAKKSNAADVTAELAKKANATDVEALTTEVGKKANAADMTAELAKKINAADLQNLTSNKVDKTAERHVKQGTYTVSADGSVTLTKVDGEGTEKADEAVVINGFATKASVDNLTTEVGKKANAAEVIAELAKKANADDVTAELAKKANATDVEALTTEVGKKANAEDVTAELAKKANADDVTVELAKKANADDVTAALAKKANADDVTAELAKKANATDVEALTTEVGKKADAATVTAELAKKADQTAVEALTTEVGKKADAATVTAELAKKANADDVTAELAKKANADDVTAELAKKANADDVTAELAKKANASDLQNLTTNKLDKASELHVQKGEYEVAEDGTVTLTKVNGNGEVVADEAVKIKGLVTRAQIASLGDLSSNGRDGVNGTSANKGLTAQDGLNGKTLAEKVNALRNGEAGTLVYTDKDGHRLVKAKDGNYYRAEAVLSDGTVKPEVELPEGIKPEKVEKPELRIVSPDGTTTPAKLSNIENGTVAENSKDAVNGGQLFAANKNVADIIGTTLDANGQLVTPTFNVKDKDNKNATSVVQAINLMNEKLDSSNKDLADLSDAGKKVITDLVDVKGDNNITVTPSVDEKTKVKTFIAKLNDTIALGKGDNAVTINGTNGTVIAKNVKANDGVFGAPADAKGVPMAAGNTTTINSDGLSVVSKDAAGNVSKVEIKDGKISGLTGSEYNSYKIDKDGNIVKDSNNNPVVDAKVNVGGNGITITPTEEVKSPVSLTKDGLNNGGNHITNIAPGKDDSDAATVGQVNDAIAQTAGNIGRALEKTSQRVNQVGAHAAALAAMNPLSYDPLRKSQIMAGIGTYSGNQALALGVAHYANENFMFNVGVSMGEGKSMANVGATYRFGTGDDDNIPERYKGGPISSVYVMQDEISALKAENARKDVEYGNKIDMLMERIAMLEAKLK